MNNTFDIKRFWNYFKYDFTGARNDAGLTLAILGAMPFFGFFCTQAFALILNGHVTHYGIYGKIASIVTAVIIAVLFFPAKHYGPLTEKKRGSDWLMLPASRLEKWLSMLLLTCLVVPAFLLAGLAVTDGLLSLIFNGTYGSTAISQISSSMNLLWGEFRTEEGRLAISWPFALYLNLCEQMLLFTLGAIYFKKSKVGMTFLSCFLLMMLFSMGSIAFMKALGISDWAVGPENISQEGFIIRLMNIIVYSVYLLFFAIMDLLIYLRIKTLKH